MTTYDVHSILVAYMPERKRAMVSEARISMDADMETVTYYLRRITSKVTDMLALNYGKLTYKGCPVELVTCTYDDKTDMYTMIIITRKE